MGMIVSTGGVVGGITGVPPPGVEDGEDHFLPGNLAQRFVPLFTYGGLTNDRNFAHVLSFCHPDWPGRLSKAISPPGFLVTTLKENGDICHSKSHRKEVKYIRPIECIIAQDKRDDF